MKKFFILTLGLVLLSISGCGDTGTPSTSTSTEKPSSASSIKPEASTADKSESADKAKDGDKTDSEDKAKEEVPAAGLEEKTAKEDPGVNKKAEAGVTGKGNYGDMSGKPMSIVTVPVSTYFRAKERTVFDMQIPQAMKLYQASNGSLPATQDEFVVKIIKENNIRLPKLKPGDYYYYDARSGQLMVHAKK